MADYLKKFETTAEYDAFIATDYPKPNVSYIESTNEVKYQDNDAMPICKSIGMGDYVGEEFDPRLCINEVTIPTECRAIGEHAFEWFGISNINIPTSITSIGENAFAFSLLSDVTVPSTVEEMGESAFYGCPSLVTATIEGETTGDYTFDGCVNLEQVAMPNAKVIGRSVCMNCPNLADVRLGDYEEIGNSAFYGCTSLGDLDLNENLQTIGTDAFRGCTSISEVVYYDDLATIGICAFKDCSQLADFTYGGTHSRLTTIGASAFEGTAMQEIYLEQSITSIGAKALQSVLTVVCYAPLPPTITANTFRDPRLRDISIYVPNNSVNTYKAASNWSAWADYIHPIGATWIN